MRKLLPVFAFLPCLAIAQSDCTTALPVGLGIHSTGHVNGTAPSLLCVGANPGGAGIWYSFTASADTSVLLSTHVDGFDDHDTRMHVYTGTCSNLTCYASDDDSGPSYSSVTTFPVTSGTTYLIAFDSYWNDDPFIFELRELYTPPPPEGLVNFTSTPIPGASGIMGVVDMNNDGLDDAISPGSNSFIISYQLPEGDFISTTFSTTPAEHTASWSFAIGDWDSNGYRDLMYGGGSGPTFMKADGAGLNYTQINFPEYIFCQRTNFVDINNDGHLDAFSCHDVDANVAFLNDGNGNLVFTQGGYGTTCGNYGSIWTDITGDGAMDLFVAKCGCDPTDLMMTNNGTGTLTNIAPEQGLDDNHQSWSSAWGDLDNDGDIDGLIGSSGGGGHKLLRNNGDGTFTDVTVGSGMDTFNGSSIEWTTHDFNNDGLLDILGGDALHYNAGNMIFSHDNTAPYNNAIGDLNNDGFMDIANGTSYYRNSGNSNNWIKVVPVGVVSNRDAIGARVYVTSALGTQLREVRSGDGFKYMSYIGANFGLGPDTQVEEIRIEWPSGYVDVIENPSINSTITVVEGTFSGVSELNGTGTGIFPNPATDRITVTGLGQNAPVSVLDAEGKLVMAERISGGRLDVSALAPGVYQLVSKDGSATYQKRFTKQ